MISLPATSVKLGYWLAPSSVWRRVSDVLVLGCGRRFDTLDDQAGLVSLGVASLLLDFEEKLPGFGCDRLREVLDIVRAACRVDDLVEMRLVLEQQLDVAGDALRELGRVFERGVERHHLQRMYAGDRGRHGLGQPRSMFT